MSMWLKNTAPTFAVQFAPDGDPADVGTDVTVTVTRADGTVLVTDDPTSKTGTGADTQYEWTLAANLNTRVDVLTLEWTDASTGEKLTTTEEIVGALLFTEAEAKAFDDAKLAGIPDADIVSAHDRIVETFEDFCGIGFVPRYARGRFVAPSWRNPFRLPLFTAELDYGGPGAPRLLRSVINADDDGTTVSTGSLTLEAGAVSRSDTHWTTGDHSNPYPITVDWEYGHRAPPRDVRQAALTLARYELVARDITDRMISVTDPNLGTVRLSTPSADRPTGIPHVDSTLQRYRQDVALA